MKPFPLSGLLTIVSALALAGFVWSRCRDRRLARIWLLFNLSVGMWGLCALLSGYVTHESDALLLWRATGGFGVLWIPCFHLHFVNVLCGRERPRELLVHYLIAAGFLSIWWTPLIYKEAQWVFGSLYYGIGGTAFMAYVVWWLSLVAYIHIVLIRATRTGSDEQKNRLRTYAISTAIGYAGGSQCFAPVFGIEWYPWGNFLIALYPVLMGYAILRHRLLEIQVVVRRTFLYSVLTASLTAIYLATLAFLSAVFGRYTDGPTTLTYALAAGIIAILFHPFRMGLQTWLDRRFPRESLSSAILKEATSGFAHEIKRPLANISLPAQLALVSVDDVLKGSRTVEQALPKVRDQLAYIVKQSIDAGQKMEALHDLVSDEPVKTGLVDLATLVDKVLEAESGRIGELAIVVTFQNAEASEPLEGNPQQIEVVILNLIRNAIDALGSGKDSNGRTVRIETKPQGEWMELVISDNGPGIPAEDRRNLFKPYFTTKGSHGTGVGLFLSRQIVERHGGSLRIEDGHDKGTTFIVQLPLRRTK
jgi:signal transduction histidine kinase